MFTGDRTMRIAVVLILCAEVVVAHGWIGGRAIAPMLAPVHRTKAATNSAMSRHPRQ